MQFNYKYYTDKMDHYLKQINKNIEISFKSIKNCLTSLFLTILDVIHSVMLEDVFVCHKKM